MLQHFCHCDHYCVHLHLLPQAFIVTIKCDKVLAAKDRLSCPGVDCQLKWGITDMGPNHIRKANTRHLYVAAFMEWAKYTENWQPEVNKFIAAICKLIEPLIIDEPTQEELEQRGNLPEDTWIDKVSVAAAFRRAEAVAGRMTMDKSTVQQAGLVLDILKGTQDFHMPLWENTVDFGVAHTAQGALAKCTQSAASTETLGASALGAPTRQVSFQSISRGFTKDEHGNIVMQSNFSLLKSWMWLIEHRQRILDAAGIPEDGVISGSTILTQRLPATSRAQL